jgi:hypothetical protein
MEVGLEYGNLSKAAASYSSVSAAGFEYEITPTTPSTNAKARRLHLPQSVFLSVDLLYCTTRRQ